MRAAALQDPLASASGFNLIVADLNLNEEEISQFTWSGNYYALENRRVWSKTRAQRAIHRQFTLLPSFLEELNDPGTGFTHPRKKRISIDDIYVTPKLSRIIGSGKKQRNEDELEPATAGLGDVELSIVIGESKSGKTTLAKRLFLHHYEGKQGIVPLLLSGHDITTSHLASARLWKLVEKVFASQYDPGSLERFSQLDRSLRFIIVDKWQSCELNEAARAEVVEELARLSSRLVFFADETFKIDKAEVYTGPFSDRGEFVAAKILPFGHVLRAALIKKWLVIGREKTLTAESLHDQLYRAESIVNTVLGRSLLPSFPFFLLSLLQIDQSLKTSNHVNGSYGYLYDSLITMALAEVSQQATEVDVYYTVLGKFAWSLHRANRTGLGVAEFTSVLTDYADEYKAAFEPADIKNRLLRANILVYQEDEYSFRYQYIYYFFMARYLADQMKTPEYAAESRAAMLRIADGIELEENANIVIFLIYLTRDADLIAKLLLDAKSLFADADMFDADTHVAFLAPAVQQLLSKETLVVDRTPEENREEERKSKDQEEAFVESEEEERAQSEFAKAVKSIGILGQIVRNFPGSMPGKLKVEITSEVYRLGLRLLGSVIGAVAADEERFRNFLRRAVRGSLRDAPERKLSDEFIEKRVDKIVVLYLDLISISVLKIVTSAVGSAQLKPTYDQVRSALGSTAAVNLIDLSIGLDHGTEFPKGKILELNEELQKKWFAHLMLRRLVANHFRMFHVDRISALKVASKIGISMTSPEIVAQLAIK